MTEIILPKFPGIYSTQSICLESNFPAPKIYEPRNAHKHSHPTHREQTHVPWAYRTCVIYSVPRVARDRPYNDGQQNCGSKRACPPVPNRSKLLASTSPAYIYSTPPPCKSVLNRAHRECVCARARARVQSWKNSIHYLNVKRWAWPRRTSRTEKPGNQNATATVQTRRCLMAPPFSFRECHSNDVD